MNVLQQVPDRQKLNQRNAQINSG